MATMIDQRPSFYGEAFVWDKLKEFLPSQHVVYNNREINGREYDVCVLLGASGILIMEIKGWRSDTISVNGVDEIIVEGYSTSQRSPKKQARAYRFALLNKFKEKYNISPLVFDMVCYPFITRDEYLEKRLDIVSEEQLTIFQEDLDSADQLLGKIMTAYDMVKLCPHSFLTEDLITKIRQDWEPHYIATKEFCSTAPARQYSTLSIFPNPVEATDVQMIVDSYFFGIKQLVFVSDQDSYIQLIKSIDQGFASRNIQPKGNQLAIGYSHALRSDTPTLLIFNLEIELCPDLPSVCSNKHVIIEGNLVGNQESILQTLSSMTPFNFEQYRVEHASAENNALVEAGAGTGKTYSMVSRVAFLSNKANHSVSNIAEEIGMVTFTNDAATSMKVRLKQMFTNYYILTGDPKFLKFLEDIDRARISTIHSFALNLLREESIYTGLGTGFRITSNEYLRGQIYDVRLSKFLAEQERTDPNFTNAIPVPVYDLKKKAIALADRLLAKSTDLSRITRKDMGVTVEKNIPYFNDMIEYVIIPSENEYFARLHEQNSIDLKESLILLYQVLEQKTYKFRNLKIRYLFIDEFQDTDDVQIEVFQMLQKAIDAQCCLFVVGDLKQSIYRFRGAKLSAFQKLQSQGQFNWDHFHLNINYRTDGRLLDLFDDIFSSMGAKNYLPYSAKDRLQSRINTGIRDDQLMNVVPCHANDEEKFFDKFINLLMAQRMNLTELMQKREQEGDWLNENERTIAILVRSNWQVEKLVEAARKRGLHIDIRTGGDLFQIPSTVDLYKLACALVNCSNPVNLLAFIESNYTNLRLNYHSYHGLSSEEILSDFNRILDEFFELRMGMSWHQVIAMTYSEPVLSVLKKMYDSLQPWKNYSINNHEQHHYMVNYEYLLECIIKYARVDSLTLNQIVEYLRINIVTGQQQMSKSDIADGGEIRMICTTVHKSKGLEYGTVILPYTDDEIDNLRKIKTDANYQQSNLAYTVQFENKIRETNSNYNFDEEVSEQVSEESRILYVALTRAIHSCVWMKNLDSQPGLDWNSLLEV